MTQEPQASPGRAGRDGRARPGFDRAALERAIAFAEARYHHCDVCAERCGVDRHAAAGGTCGLGSGAIIYKEYIHFGEERRLLPSHTIYFTGCSFRCAFCSDWDQVVRPLDHGVEVPPQALALRIAQRRAEGAANVNFVGGVPDVNLLYILRVLRHCPDDTHVVWNTNLWSTPEVLAELRGVVGTWLADLKFGPGPCGKKLARVTRGDYFETVTGLLPLLPRERVLVRHLLMPGHLECCTKPALDWLAEHMPDAAVNLMTGYEPFKMRGGDTGRPMARRNPPSEVEAALAHFASRRFDDRMVDGVEWDPAR